MPTNGVRLGADVLAAALAANGFQIVPVNPGATEEILSSALERAGLPAPLLVYQELTGLGFAAGVLLGQPVIADAEAPDRRGPARAAVIAHGMVGLGGMASFITGFAQQKLPILILIGNAGVMEDSLGKHQNPNGGLEQLARGAGCKGVFWVTEPASLMHQLKRAVMLAEAATPGPVALVVPQNGVMGAPSVTDARIERIPYRAHATAPGATAIRDLAQRLCASSAPVLLVGDEVARTGAIDALVAVAEGCGARVIGSMAHQLCFPMDHPLWSGSTGHVFGASVPALLAGADCVVSIGGIDLSMVLPTAEAPYDPECWVGYLGEDEAAAAAMYRVSAAPIIASPRIALQHLATAIEEHHGDGRATTIAARREAVAARNLAARAARCNAWEEESRTVALHAYDVVGALRTVLAERGMADETTIFNEGLTRADVIETLLLPRRPGSYFSSQGGSLGYAGPIACGLAYARPGKQIIAISGDGGFLYTPQWLLTARENRLPVKMIVFQDDAYNLLIQLAHQQGRSAPDIFRLGAARQHVRAPASIDLPAIAAGLGAVRAERIDTRADILDAVRRLLGDDEPAMLVAAINP